MIRLDSAKYRVLTCISRNVPVPLDQMATTALIELRRERLVSLQREADGKPLKYIPTVEGWAALRGAA